MHLRLYSEDISTQQSRKPLSVSVEYDELERLYCDCRQQLFTCALGITYSPALAEDAVHNAFVRLIRRRMNGDGISARDLKAYVFRAVRNAAVDMVRRRGISPEPLPAFVFDLTSNAAVLTEEAEYQAHVVEQMLQLSSDERETIVQHLYGGLTFREISIVREVPLGTVTSWYRRGLEKLRRLLEVADGTV